MGILRIWGTLDTAQFWPQGVSGHAKGSDADTIKMVVDKKRVLFNGVRTSALSDAYVVDMGKKNFAINSLNTSNIRLQGVDAPELHFPTTVKKTIAQAKNGNFRQAWGETASTALCKFLRRKFGTGKLTCELVSQNIDEPQDVCDVHGRVVGNILVEGLDINLWLLDQGWAFPAFYDGMLKDEIAEAMTRAKQALEDGRGIWPDYKAQAFFDPDMVFRRTDEGDGDDGPVLFPKLFRRAATSYVTHGSLDDLLADIRASKLDRYVRTAAFLKGDRSFKQWGRADGGAVRATPGGKVKLAVQPWDIVLKEEPSVLYRDENAKRRKVMEF
jgi:endonuclease YncB( thermonuclease family)